MPSITIKSIPEALYERLKRRAKTNHRSLNGEILECLEQSSTRGRPDVEGALQRIDAIHKKSRLTPLTNAVIRRARDKGRP